MNSQPAFSMPMYQPGLVPKWLQPWLYIVQVFGFQLSMCVYLGALNPMIGSRSMMREDLTMCLYANLLGMALWFPMLFRMKFRFTNRTLLIGAAAGVILCQVVGMSCDWLPLLWVVCVLEGICKIQGTFECMSNIQLWMTPKRDFTIFFPLLHIIIMCALQLNDILATWFAYIWSWPMMHYAIILYMLVIIMFQIICCRHVRMMPRMPLYGIDWLGLIVWLALGLQVAYIFNYGDWLKWWQSATIRALTLTSALTLFLAVVRMNIIRHPYISPGVFTRKHIWPLMLLIVITEALMCAEYVCEEVYFEEVMGWSDMQSVWLNWVCIGGVLIGCLLAWMVQHEWRLTLPRQFACGMALVVAYHVLMYFTVTDLIPVRMLWLPVMCRGAAVATLGASMLLCLHEMMDFMHFFQALGLLNVFHLMMGGVIGAAGYARALAVLVPDNLSRYGSYVTQSSLGLHGTDLREMSTLVPEMVERMMLVSIKQIYGVTSYIAIATMIVLLCLHFRMPKDWKPMPLWRSVGAMVKNTYRRNRKRAAGRSQQ